MRRRSLDGHVRGGLGRSRRLAGHEIGHTGIGFQATQQLYAGVQEVIDLSLVIAFLALALGEDHIVDRIRIEIGQRPYIVFGNAVNAQSRPPPCPQSGRPDDPPASYRTKAAWALRT